MAVTEMNEGKPNKFFSCMKCYERHHRQSHYDIAIDQLRALDSLGHEIKISEVISMVESLKALEAES